MKFWEAIKALAEGKKVRAKHWDVGAYWAFKPYDSLCLTTADIFVLCTLEWELYEDSEQTLSFAEVVKGLKEGKKFKREGWVNCYIYCRYDGSICDNKNVGVLFQPIHFEATDWVEVV